MTKVLFNLGIVITLLCMSCELVAQSDIALATRKAELQTLSKNLQKRDENNRRQAQEFARRAGIPIRRELPNGRVLELQRIAPGIGPIFYITNNVDAADTVSTDEVWPGGSAGLDLDGSGMTVAEWDGGAVFADHPDFTGRLTQVDGATVVSDHSTHVAGTLIGAGEWLYAESRGMAYAAHLNAYDWNSDTSEMALAASNGQLISNHSYGIAAGWIYTGDPNPPDTWWWIGGEDPSDVEDPYFGYYDSESQLWDQIAFDAPYYLIIKASGNDRTDIGPAPGEEYTIIDQNGDFVSISTLPRNADCAPAGFDCLPTHSVAKNVLTVGAVDDLIGGYSIFSGPSSIQMAEFSGWGPTDDGRIKPDLVGNGMFLVSAWSSPAYYAAAAGTSMSAPNVTGSLLLLQQHYEDINGPDNFMRAATLKALAIHSADEAGSADGPDYAFGWGLLNTKSAAQVISDNGGAHRIIEGNLLNGAVDIVEINVIDADAVITATLVWTDPPGTPVALALDAPDLMLVNDLDLRIKKGPSTYMPWVLNPAFPAAAATTGDNFRDNVEQVAAEGGGTGSYFIEVSHKGATLDGGNQGYSLIISVRPPPPSGSTLLIDENFSGGLPAGWSLNKVTGIDWTFQTPIPGDSRLDNLTGGSGNFAMVDANYSNPAVTFLQMPTFDLSTTTAVVLRFKSYLYFDESENINVDVSTDGGSGWTNVWTFQGFNPIPTLYTLDLSGVAAGQASVSIRFHYNNYGAPMGNIWQVDDVELEVFGGGTPPGEPPGQATSPNPADGATGLGYDTDLSWSAGTLATSHDVYFGTDPTPDASESQGNHGGTSFDPGTLADATTYYWRIDEVNADGTTTGSVWSFSTEAAAVLPGTASNLSPAEGASNVSITANLSWAAGSDTDSHNVYFGASSPPAPQGNQAGTSFDPGPLAYSTTYYWRVDEVNAEGTTTGAEWSFTTEATPPVDTAVHVDALTGSSTPGSRNRWTASVQIDVMDQDLAPVSGLVVDGSWSNGASGSPSCTTNASGQCSVSKSNLKANVAGVVFSVTNISGADVSYDGGANAVSQVTVFRDGGGGNLLPNAVNDSYITTVDVAVNGNVLNNDDEGDAPATVTSHDATSVQGVPIIVSASGGFSYTPPAGYDGGDSFGYTITDSNGDSESATVLITIDPAGGNLLPDAVDDNYPTDQGAAFSANVMDNDDEGDAPATVTSHDPLSAQDVPISVGSGGAFTYTPPASLTGSDSFAYTITDNNGDSDTATVIITISPVGSELTLSVSKLRDKGTWYGILSWSGGVGDATVTITRNALPLAGSPTANDGEFSDQIGKKVSGTFEYEVCDSGGCASDSVSF